MFGFRPPEKVPEHISREAFWSRLRQFALFTGITVSVHLAIRLVERRANDQLTQGL